MSTKTSNNEDTVVTMEEISKYFGEIVALEDVNFQLRREEVLGLVGDNGAGKSTLIKCLAGAHQPDEGDIRIDGEKVTIDNPRDAKRIGIETTFQNLALADNLSVAQNIFLGREKINGIKGIGILDKEKMEQRAEELLDDLEVGVDSQSTVRNLSGGERQLVAITRTLLSDPKIIIMDEPTSALSVEGVERVLNLIERMRERGISIILISHNLEDIQQAVDRVQVLHQGHNAGDLDIEDATRDEIVNRMIGGKPQESDGEDTSQESPA
jgi:ABC-type sugar transport system ATPase subunit